MSATARRAIAGVGALAIIVGLYMAATGRDFDTYASGIFIGTMLIGAVYASGRAAGGDEDDAA